MLLQPQAPYLVPVQHSCVLNCKYTRVVFALDITPTPFNQASFMPTLEYDRPLPYSLGRLLISSTCEELDRA